MGKSRDSTTLKHLKVGDRVRFNGGSSPSYDGLLIYRHPITPEGDVEHDCSLMLAITLYGGAMGTITHIKRFNAVAEMDSSGQYIKTHPENNVTRFIVRLGESLFTKAESSVDLKLRRVICD